VRCTNPTPTAGAAGPARAGVVGVACTAVQRADLGHMRSCQAATWLGRRPLHVDGRAGCGQQARQARSCRAPDMLCWRPASPTAAHSAPPDGELLRLAQKSARAGKGVRISGQQREATTEEGAPGARARPEPPASAAAPAPAAPATCRGGGNARKRARPHRAAAPDGGAAPPPQLLAGAAPRGVKRRAEASPRGGALSAPPHRARRPRLDDGVGASGAGGRAGALAPPGLAPEAGARKPTLKLRVGAPAAAAPAAAALAAGAGGQEHGPSGGGPDGSGGQGGNGGDEGEAGEGGRPRRVTVRLGGVLAAAQRRRLEQDEVRRPPLLRSARERTRGQACPATPGEQAAGAALLVCSAPRHCAGSAHLPERGSVWSPAAPRRRRCESVGVRDPTVQLPHPAAPTGGPRTLKPAVAVPSLLTRLRGAGTRRGRAGAAAARRARRPRRARGARGCARAFYQPRRRNGVHGGPAAAAPVAEDAAGPGGCGARAGPAPWAPAGHGGGCMGAAPSQAAQVSERVWGPCLSTQAVRVSRCLKGAPAAAVRRGSAQTSPVRGAARRRGRCPHAAWHVGEQAGQTACAMRLRPGTAYPTMHEVSRQCAVQLQRARARRGLSAAATHAGQGARGRARVASERTRAPRAARARARWRCAARAPCAALRRRAGR